MDDVAVAEGDDMGDWAARGFLCLVLEAETYLEWEYVRSGHFLAKMGEGLLYSESGLVVVASLGQGNVAYYVAPKRWRSRRGGMAGHARQLVCVSSGHFRMVDFRLVNGCAAVKTVALQPDHLSTAMVQGSWIQVCKSRWLWPCCIPRK